MADKLVDILGFLQPDSGNNWSAGIFLDGNAKIMYAFEDATAPLQDFSFYGTLYEGAVAISALNTGPKTYAELYKYLNDQKLLPDVPDKNNLPPVIVGYAGPNTNKQNVIVNINKRPIFQRVYYAKWACLKELESTRTSQYLFDVAENVRSYETSLLRGKVAEANSRENQFAGDLLAVTEEVSDNIKSGRWDKNKIPACFLPDPAPALPGPPSQTIYGTLNKPPTVDDANMFLPSSEPKALNPSESLDKLTAEGGTVKSSVTETVTTKSVETVSGGGATVRTSFAANDPRASMTYAQLDALPKGAGQTEFKIPGKDSVTTTTESVSTSVDKVTSASGTDVVAKLQADTNIVSKPAIPSLPTPPYVKDGLGDQWSPDKFKPETIAGNTKFVDPTTGNIGSTEQLAAVNNLKGSLPDVPKPNIPSLSDFAPPTNITNADAALTKLTGENIGSLNPNSAIQSPSSLVQGATGGLLGGGLGAGIGALAGGGKGALVGGLSGAALGGGLAIGGVGGGLLAGAGLGGGIGAIAGGGKGAAIGAIAGGGLAIGGVGGGLLAGAGLGGGIGAIAGGGKGAAIGAVTGGALGAAAAKLASVKIGMPKPNIPKPPNIPRIKVVKIKHPSDIKGAQQLLNLQKPKLGQ